MPGAVPRTSTLALTNATTPYTLTLAADGWEKACRADRALALGVNMVEHKVTCRGVAEAFDLEYTPVEEVLARRRFSGALNAPPATWGPAPADGLRYRVNRLVYSGLASCPDGCGAGRRCPPPRLSYTYTVNLYGLGLA